jgi:regulator of PEP synthase PpsR (kinase-PPPase family)
LCEASKGAILPIISLWNSAMAQKRSAFFISDRTGITAEMLGHSLLTQFEMVAFNEVTLPFIDTVAKAEATVRQINDQGAGDGMRPLIFSTLVAPEIAAVVSRANALFLDCFEIFIRPMEKELGVAALHAVGKSHSANDFANYHHRIEAIN